MRRLRDLGSIGLILLLFPLGCGKDHEDHGFERNPNLGLVISYAHERKSCFRPVWSPDGNKIYYLLTRTGRQPWEAGGQLRMINTDGTGDRLVLDGEFGALAVSPDGSELALTADASSENGGSLILADTEGVILNTVSTSASKVLDVQFCSDGSQLYYYAYEDAYDSLDGFYEMNLATGADRSLIPLKKTPVFRGFDVSSSDSSLFHNSVLHNIAEGSSRDSCPGCPHIWPQFRSSDDKYIVYSGDCYALDQDLRILDLSANDVTNLNAMPYALSSFFGSFWSPDGNNLVLAVGRFDYEPPHPEFFELWILEKVWK